MHNNEENTYEACSNWITSHMSYMTIEDLYDFLGVTEKEGLEMGLHDVESLVYDGLERQYYRTYFPDTKYEEELDTLDFSHF